MYVSISERLSLEKRVRTLKEASRSLLLGSILVAATIVACGSRLDSCRASKSAIAISRSRRLSSRMCAIVPKAHGAVRSPLARECARWKDV
eukprot:4729637-Prorocentrum_lima.AAC.1